MTAAMSTDIHAPARSQSLQLGPTLIITLIAIYAVSAMNLLDPMIRHDDYPAFFGDGAAFWNKTLHEGRWLNYIWHLRGFVTPSWVNFVVYQGLWAVVVASIAVVAAGPKGASWYTVVLALMMLVSPSEMLISVWFNTLLPGLAGVALFGFLACRVSNRALRAMLPVFIIVSFMSYTSYPLLLLAICIVKTDNRSMRDLAGLMFLFCVSFVAAVLVVYAINWQVHGIFGVPVADWREPTTAHGIFGMFANLPKLGETFQILFHRNGFGFAPLIGLVPVMTVVAFWVLFKRDPIKALYMLAGLAIGIALMVVQVLKLGILVPPRAFMFAWIFACLAIVQAVQVLSVEENLLGRIGRNAILLVVGVYLVMLFGFYSGFKAWQSETRAIAQELVKHDGEVFVYGDASKIAQARDAGIQSYEALFFRLKLLTGREVTTCYTDADTCPAKPDLGDTGETEIHIRRTEAGTFLIFTPLPEDQASDPA